MSHVICYANLAVTALDVLRSVAEEVGLELVEATTYKWYGSWVNDYSKEDAAYKLGIKPEQYGKCDGWKLRLKNNPNAYEIGLHKNPNGPGYVLVYDFYGAQGGALKQAIGGSGEKIKQAYVAALTKKQLKAKGFRVVEDKKLDNGKQRIRLQRMA